MTEQLVPFVDLLSNIVDNRGRTCPTSNTGMPLIATNCISNDRLYPSNNTERFVDDNTYKNWFRGHPEPGDIIFVNKGTPGRVCMVPQNVNFCIAQDMVAVRANPDKVYPRFLFALLRSKGVQDKIAQLHVGTLIPHFKKGDFDKLILSLPSRQQQELIGDTYFDISSKIELNYHTNETLGAISQALFKSWFVDFDPVKAKAAGKKTGLPKEIDKLFPSLFQDTELGRIPKGWSIGTVGDLAEIVGGTTPSTKENKYWVGGNNNWVTPKDLSSLKCPVLLSTERCITDAGLATIGSGLLPKGTVLLSSRAPIGYLAITEIPVAINQGFIAMKPKKDRSNIFLLLWARHNHELIVSRANGTTFLEISKSSFRPLPAVIPPQKVMNSFDSQSRTVYAKIVLNEKRSITLASVRDVLLPKLINGDIVLSKG